MVDFSHLSAGGDSESSPSRDLFAEHGVSRPSSPASIQGVDDMGESNPCPTAVCVDSDESVDSRDLNPLLGLGEDSGFQEIFRAASTLTSKDRIEAVEERKKNQVLMDFILAHGFSTAQINDFKSKGSVVNSTSARQVLDERPKILEVGSPSEPYKPGPILREEIENPDGTPSTNVVAPKPSWRDVVKQVEKEEAIHLDFFPPSPPPAAGSPVLIRPPVDILQLGNSLWKSCLVGGFLHSRLPFKLVSENAHKLWDKYGLRKVLLQDKGYFIFKFSSPADCDNVLALGPWYIANKLLVLKKWKEGIDLSVDSCTRTPVWVKFHRVPLSYWTPKGLSYLASGIGKPLVVDKFTSRLEPMSFARICIEISIESELPDKLNVIVLDEESSTEIVTEVLVEYQNKPQICQHCKSFGHSMLRCPRANFKWVPKATSSKAFEERTLGGQVSAEPISAADTQIHSHGVEGLEQGNGNWTVVGSKNFSYDQCPGSASILPDLENQFLPLLSSGLGACSDLDSPAPSNNPLVSKLKIVDELEGKELKNKDRRDGELSQKSKKKSKRGAGGSSKPPN